jgi:outer membrane protein assembly factor BamB
MAGLVYFSTATGLRTSHAQRYIKVGERGTYALDARTGKLVWRQRIIGQYAPIVADDQRVLLIGATRVYGLVPRKRK